MGSNATRRALVTGAGGFIGGHLARALLERGFAHVRCADGKDLGDWHQVHADAERLVLDLRGREDAARACDGMTDVFHLACDTGGVGFTARHGASGALNVVLDARILLAARDRDVACTFFASAACNPALPQDGHRRAKLFAERLCLDFAAEFAMQVRVARLHGVYGPHGPWDGGRERAPAAICRKVIGAQMGGERRVEIWGDGRQRRSFTYVDDCVEGILRVHDGDCPEPLDVGSSETVTLDRLVDMVEDIAGLKLVRTYDPSAPTGAPTRSSDNARIRKELGWEPHIPLRGGLVPTYAWIESEMRRRAGRGR